jgi:urease accessory protein
VGERTTSILREEFVTPPEFRGLDSLHHPAGRVGGGRIELVRSGDETQMGYCYQQIPMRVMPPFSFENEPGALLYLINLTAGLMDGDAHLVQIKARKGVRAMVTGQSATRVHPALKSFATQQWEVDVEEDACLVVLPGPTIPYKGCRYFQRGRATLAASSRLIWGDIWLPGRYDRSGELMERFVFDRIVQDLEIRREGELLFRDRFRWDGPWKQEEAQWYFGGELAIGSLVIAGPLPESLPAPAEGVKRSIFPMDTGVTCVRWCGHPTPVTADLAQMALSIAAAWTMAPGSPSWFLDSSSLTKNHWFSTM